MPERGKAQGIGQKHSTDWDQNPSWLSLSGQGASRFADQCPIRVKNRGALLWLEQAVQSDAHSSLSSQQLLKRLHQHLFTLLDKLSEVGQGEIDIRNIVLGHIVLPVSL